MKKGFTLIELLAVIVILAIIALIATPIVLNIISDSKKSATIRSAENYLSAVEQAVARKNLDGKFDPSECYIPEGGNGKTLICTLGDNTKKDLMVEINGATLASGATLEFTKGNVTAIVDLKIDGNDVSASSLGLDVATRILCRAVTNATTGNVPTGNYNYGDEYVCNLGDGIERIFFIIEDGDNTTLSKYIQPNLIYETDPVGTTDPGEVSLIMNDNIGDNVAWINQEDWEDAGGDVNSIKNDDGPCQQADICANMDYGPITALNYLHEKTSLWNKLRDNQIVLPTYTQLNTIYTSNNNIMPQYLYGGIPTSNEGYWLASAYELLPYNAWVVYENYFGQDLFHYDNYWGVRPVISISKLQLK